MSEDRVPSKIIRDTSAHQLCAIVADYDLVDVGSILSGNSVVFTHFQGQSHARLDRLYVSANLARTVNSYAVKHVSFSDHSLVTCTLGTKHRGSHFNWELWKMNETILSDEWFVKTVKGKLT